MRRIGHLLSAMLPAMAVLSCQKLDVTTDESMPMAFSILDTKAGIYNTHESFNVWATRVASPNTTLMDGYRVNYVGTEWTYTEGDGTDSQGMRYWDAGATSFRFHAGAPYSAVSSISADELQLSMTAPVTSAAGTVLYSTPKTVLPVNYGKTVPMVFNHAYARIDFYFRLATQQTGNDASDRFYIRNITINPTNKNTFTKAATCTVSYDWDANTATPSYAATANSSSEEKISIGDAVYKPSQTGPTGNYKSPNSIHMVPIIGTPVNWLLSLKYDGVTKVYTIPAEKCNWKAGKKYTYKVDVHTDFIMLSDVSVEDWVDETIDIEIEGE